MRRHATSVCLALAAALVLSACASDREPQLMNLRNPSDGPDEFLVVPAKPLVMPEDMAALPTPTPGGRNLADATPREDMIAALGGNAAVARGGSGGLVAYAARFGTAPNIRAELAVADLEYRRQNNGRLLERWFSIPVYFDAYAPLSLDQTAELDRFRRAGVRTPSAPPAPIRTE
jgi:hypothetical protein